MNATLIRYFKLSDFILILFGYPKMRILDIFGYCSMTLINVKAIFLTLWIISKTFSPEMIGSMTTTVMFLVSIFKIMSISW